MPEIGEMTISLNTLKLAKKLEVAAEHFQEMSKQFNEIDKVELEEPEVEELELDLEEVAEDIHAKLSKRGLFAAKVPIEELIYILKLETEYMEENGFTGKLDAIK